MQHGDEMDARELRRQARKAIGNRNQKDVAEALGVSPATISHALNHDTPSRYGGTLGRNVEEYTDFSIEPETTTTTVYRAKKKG